MTETEVVRAFFAALEKNDKAGALALCSDDVIYQNVPLPATQGRAGMEKQLGSIAKVAPEFGVEITNIAADGPVVLTERRDTLGRGPVKAEFWVCGTFEVRDGRITLWRDYFDWTTVLSSGVMGAGKAALDAVRRSLGR